MASHRHLMDLRRARAARAFSVIELMLAVSLMGVIIYALYAVFNQTQRAMRSSQVQTDVSEKARAVMEMITREIEQAEPTFVGVFGNQETNMCGGPELDHPPQIINTGTGPNSRSDIQSRTNFLENVFFIRKQTNSWFATGYRVIYLTNSVGVLQKYANFNSNPTNGPVGMIRGTPPFGNVLSSNFVSAPIESTNFYHVADGVIHFSVIPYDNRGYPLRAWDSTNGYPGMNSMPAVYHIERRNEGGGRIAGGSDFATNRVPNVLLQKALGVSPEVIDYGSRFAFLSNALPAYVDVQLGILEPEVLTQYYKMVEEGNPNAASYLARQVARVHLFRQRIPIRTAVQ